MDQNSKVSRDRVIREMKRTLRNDMREKRDNESKIIRTEWDRQITKRFMTSKFYLQSNYLLCYANFGSEVDTQRIIQRALTDGKKVYAPKIIDSDYMEFYKITKLSDLSISSYGIPEPNESEVYFDPEKLDQENAIACMVIPGLAFDKKMHRMGYGKGYYDKYLNWQIEASKDPLCDLLFKVALCYDFQMMNQVPVTNDDFKMDCIMTEAATYLPS